MSAALLLVRDSDGGSSPPPLVAWELFMRGAGRSERTVRDGVATMQRLERNAGKGCDQLAPVDVSRFLADPDLGASSRAAYFGSISAFYRWWATQGGTNITPGCRGRARRSYRRGRCRGRAYHEAVCGCVERSDMTTKKICFHCYSELFPDKPIRKVSLGRQCVVCKKSTDKVEQMVPVEAEDL